MKAVIFAATIFASVFAQAAASYDCSMEIEDGVMQMALTPVDATTMNVTIEGEVSTCQYDESAPVLAEVNANMSFNGVTVDTEIIVGCEGQTADASLYAVISKSDIVAEGLPAGSNTVILSPVAGPVAVGFCTKK